MVRNKYVAGLFIVVLMLVLQFCKPSQTTTTDTSTKASPAITVTYEKDIKPLMLERCTPCHFPETGKKKMFDTYVATKGDVNSIIERIKLSPEDPKFMPFRSKKPNLTEKEIQLFTDWLAQGMPEVGR